MLDVITALSPVISAIIGVVSYATLTNYRLDKLDEQVARISNIETRLADQDKRLSLLEERWKQLN